MLNAETFGLCNYVRYLQIQLHMILMIMHHDVQNDDHAKEFIHISHHCLVTVA